MGPRHEMVEVDVAVPAASDHAGTARSTLREQVLTHRCLQFCMSMGAK